MTESTEAGQLFGIPVLITSAVNVFAEHTRLNDVQVRLQLTLQSIEKWRSTPLVSHVVVCDGSGFDLEPYIKNINADGEYCACEVISFTNNVARVRSQGKGYGEGEIVNYALQRSKVLKNANIFAKCTGRLWVKNFDRCLKKFNGIASFDFQGKLTPVNVDTRFYIVQKEFYILNLAGLHNQVDDNKQYYLEHAYRDGLKIIKLSDYVMTPTPIVLGISGSMGIEYRQHKIKMFLRNIRSAFIKIVGLS